jgi:hypothetical protein
MMLQRSTDFCFAFLSRLKYKEVNILVILYLCETVSWFMDRTEIKGV